MHGGRPGEVGVMEQTVHLRIADAASGKLLPCRLRVTDKAGKGRVPLGYLADPSAEKGREVGGHLVRDGTVWVYTDGSCEVRLPPGIVRLEASHGPLYEPVLQESDRGLGRIAIRIQLKQAIFPAAGWYFADGRAHFLSPSAAALEGAAEGLDLVHLLALHAEETGLPRLANRFDFSGQNVLLERHGCAVCVNTYHQGGPWGDLALLYCHRIVFPFMMGEAGFEHYMLADWCYQCHRKGGLVIWPAFSGIMGERLPLALLGEIDAVEWCASSPWDEDTLQLWYALLNSGCRLSIVGASAKASNAVPLGAMRTATWLDSQQPFSLAGWVGAVKRGHTYATLGPILEWRINDRPNAWKLAMTPSPVTHESADVSQTEAYPVAGQWHIVATAQSVMPFSRLELVCGGEVLSQATPNVAIPSVRSDEPPFEPTGERARLQKIQAQMSGCQVWRADLVCSVSVENVDTLPANWLALRCWDASGLAAHTSVIHLPRRPRLSERDRRCLEQALDSSESILRGTPHPRQDELLQRLHEARRCVLTR